MTYPVSSSSLMILMSLICTTLVIMLSREAWAGAGAAGMGQRQQGQHVSFRNVRGRIRCSRREAGAAGVRQGQGAHRNRRYAMCNPNVTCDVRMQCPSMRLKQAFDCTPARPYLTLCYVNLSLKRHPPWRPALDPGCRVPRPWPSAPGLVPRPWCPVPSAPCPSAPGPPCSSAPDAASVSLPPWARARGTPPLASLPC